MIPSFAEFPGWYMLAAVMVIVTCMDAYIFRRLGTGTGARLSFTIMASFRAAVAVAGMTTCLLYEGAGMAFLMGWFLFLADRHINANIPRWMKK